MARIVHISLTLVLLLTTLIYQIRSHPIARSDLIDGTDFLSIFIGQNNNNNNNNNNRSQKDNTYNRLGTPKSTSYNENDDELNERILSIETIYSKEDELLAKESSNYGMRTEKRNRNRNRNRKEQQQHETDEIINHDTKEMITTPSEGINNPTDNPRKQIIKMVTSGSKIIFLEELTPAEIVDNNNERNSTNPDDQQQIPRNEKTKQPNSKRDNVVTFEPIENNDDLFDNTNSNKNDFINRSHKNEFVIEEIDPVTQEALSDSENVESTHIHSILAPPSTINQSPSHHMTTGSRMQRKQDKLVPFQTVIYHDTDYHKDGSTQPRSVSYSSIAQSIDELNSWKDLEGLLEVKQNLSQGLGQKIFTDSAKVYSEPEKVYGEPAKVYSEPAKMYGQPSKFYSEPAKVYSEPAKVYGQPEKQYGEPAKIYSEPAKVYSEPAKVYSQPAKMYGEPSKVYWPPSTPTPTTTTQIMMTTTAQNSREQLTTTKNPNSRRVIFNLDKLPYDLLNAPETNKKLLEPDINRRPSSFLTDKSVFASKSHNQKSEDKLNTHHHDLVTERPNYRPTEVTEDTQEIYTPTPEQNYEIEESVSVMTNGRAHGVQHLSISTTTPPSDDSKVGYVVEGRNYRKYRVEEKTPDGFIVGEYGVVSHNDGSLRGVRYTADSNINPSLIHEALMKFLSL